MVAYVVRAEGVELRMGELKEQVKKRLPEYMVPRGWVEMKELPRLGNGKLDRRALPAPSGERTERGYLAPRERIELEISRIWEQCLFVYPVGIRDNFFTLGGNSLTAMQCINIMNKILEVDVPLVELFQNPTIEELSALVRKNARSRNTFASPVIALQSRRAQKPPGAPIFYVHPLGGFAFCYLELARLLAGNHLCYGLQSPAVELNESGHLWSVGSIEDLAARYIDSIKEVEPRGPYHLCGWSFGGTVAFEIARQLQEQGDSVSSLVLLDTTFYNLETTNIRDHWREESLGLAHENEDDAELLAHLYFGDQRPVASLTSNETLDQRLEALLQRARALNVVPSEADIPWGKRVAAMVRAHRVASRRYVPSIYKGRIFFFKPAEDRASQTIDGHASNDISKLKALATEGIEVSFLPGNHLNMTLGEGAATLSKWFSEHFALNHEKLFTIAEENTSSAPVSVASY